MTQRIKLFFFWNMTYRTEPFFQYDSKKLSLSFQHDSDKYLTQRIELFSMTQRFCWIRHKESNFFLKYDQRIDFFLKICSQNFSVWFTELNFFPALLKEWNIWEDDSKHWTFIAIKHDTKNWTSFLIWLKELNLFVKYDAKSFEPFFYMTHRIEQF